MSGGNSGADVGYGHPPREFQWKPGQSGNPDGRPRRHKQLPPEGLAEALAQTMLNEIGVSKNGKKIVTPFYIIFSEQLMRDSLVAPMRDKIAVIRCLQQLGVFDLLPVIREQQSEAFLDWQREKHRAILDEIKSQLLMD